MSDPKKLTTTAGCPVGRQPERDDRRATRPATVADVWFLEKLAHFDARVIPNDACTP